MPRPRDENGDYIVPEIAVENKTVLFDPARSQIVMVLDGIFLMPPGSVVELVEPDATAKVLAVRLLTGTENFPARVRVDIEVPQEWWDDPQSANAVITATTETTS